MQRLLLELELRRWRAAGRRARLWWRDDDAREPHPALDRLLSLAAAHDAPLTLAVIPDGPRAALASRLAGHRRITTIQHGADHINRNPGGPAAEFEPERTLDDIAAALAAGWRVIAPLPGALKAFTPPWNAAHPALAAALTREGYVGWSAWAETDSAAVPPRVDTHIDLLRWSPRPRFRGAGRLTARLRRQLATRRRAAQWDAPLGLLTHHQDHDEGCWLFLNGFLDFVAQEPALSWTDLPRLLN